MHVYINIDIYIYDYMMLSLMVSVYMMSSLMVSAAAPGSTSSLMVSVLKMSSLIVSAALGSTSSLMVSVFLLAMEMRASTHDESLLPPFASTEKSNWLYSARGGGSGSHGPP